MHCKETELVGKGAVASSGATGSDGDSDVQRSQLVHTIGTGKVTDIRVKREDISGFIEAAVALVEESYAAATGASQRNGTRRSKPPGLQCATNRSGQEVGVNTIFVRFIDLDVDQVRGRHGERMPPWSGQVQGTHDQGAVRLSIPIRKMGTGGSEHDRRDGLLGDVDDDARD